MIGIIILFISNIRMDDVMTKWGFIVIFVELIMFCAAYAWLRIWEDNFASEMTDNNQASSEEGA